jgi:hypothetical protein
MTDGTPPTAHPGRQARPDPLPPDPAEYDSPRAQIARAKGLDAPYIAGGRDPDPGPALEEERRLGRLLVAMVVALMFGGFIIGLALTIATGGLPL